MNSLPYTGAVTSYNSDNYIHITAQLTSTFEPTPFQKKLRQGFTMDNHLYLHQLIDRATGEVVESYVGPIDL